MTICYLDEGTRVAVFAYSVLRRDNSWMEMAKAMKVGQRKAVYYSKKNDIELMVEKLDANRYRFVKKVYSATNFTYTSGEFSFK